jgi:hypothetical protein
MRLTPKPTNYRSGHRTYSRLTAGDTTTVAKSRLSRRGRACLRHRSLTSIMLAALLLLLSAATAHAEPTHILALAGSIDQV